MHAVVAKGKGGIDTISEVSFVSNFHDLFSYNLAICNCLTNFQMYVWSDHFFISCTISKDAKWDFYARIFWFHNTLKFLRVLAKRLNSLQKKRNRKKKRRKRNEKPRGKQKKPQKKPKKLARLLRLNLPRLKMGLKTGRAEKFLRSKNLCLKMGSRAERLLKWRFETMLCSVPKSSHRKWIF